MPVLPFNCSYLALYRFSNLPLFEVFRRSFFDNAFLNYPVSIIHPFTIFNVNLMGIIIVHVHTVNCKLYHVYCCNICIYMNIV